MLLLRFNIFLYLYAICIQASTVEAVEQRHVQEVTQQRPDGIKKDFLAFFIFLHFFAQFYVGLAINQCLDAFFYTLPSFILGVIYWIAESMGCACKRYLSSNINYPLG